MRGTIPRFIFNIYNIYYFNLFYVCVIILEILYFYKCAKWYLQIICIFVRDIKDVFFLQGPFKFEELATDKCQVTEKYEIKNVKSWTLKTLLLCEFVRICGARELNGSGLKGFSGSRGKSRRRKWSCGHAAYRARSESRCGVWMWSIVIATHDSQRILVFVFKRIVTTYDVFAVFFGI